MAEDGGRDGRVMKRVMKRKMNGKAARTAAAFLAALMIAPVCGADDGTAEAAPAAEGAVLNICCFNEEFKTRLVDHYPEYREVGPMTGQIGDVLVKWTMYSSDDGTYQAMLDQMLAENEDKPADERIDIFLAEEGFLGRYIDSEEPTAMPVAELGITDEELREQFQYTLDAASDREGVLRGLTWQCTPGVMIYNRQIAMEMWGSDQPSEVQKHVNSWESFMSAADELSQKGYSITSSVEDTFRAYAGQMSSYWVTKKGELAIPENIRSWISDSRTLVDAGETTTAPMWSTEWNAVLVPEGKVFCTFGPEWMARYCLSQDLAGTVAEQGGWAVCRGPQNFFWRGTWICAAYGTDNGTLIADIMRTMTVDEYIMANIRETDGDFVNNRKVMESGTEDERYRLDVLGGQNPSKVEIAAAKKISGVRITRYDSDLRSAIQRCAKQYFEGEFSLEEMEAEFREQVEKLYPALARGDGGDGE